MLIRPAELRDLAGIRAIINREIAEGVAHFGLVELTEDEARARFEQETPVYPWFVAEVGGAVAGLAKASAWKARGAYEWTAEVGVYVDPALQGRGIGRALYDHLFPDLEQRGFRCLLAGIALPNEPSIKLHEAMGMTRVGSLPSVGYKHGQWIDVAYWAKLLGEGDPAPIPGFPANSS